MTIFDCFNLLPAKLLTLFDIYKFSEDFLQRSIDLLMKQHRLQDCSADNK